MMELFFILIMAHFVCDYVLQTDSIATGKNRNIDEAQNGVNWYYWMTAHAATHSLAVYLLTGFIWAAIFEFITHWLIDSIKCEKAINLHVDQALHVFVKLLIVIYVLINGGV